MVATGFAARDVFFAAVLGAALIGVAWLSLATVERFEAGFAFCQMKVEIKMRRQEGEKRDVLLWLPRCASEAQA